MGLAELRLAGVGDFSAISWLIVFGTVGQKIGETYFAWKFANVSVVIVVALQSQARAIVPYIVPNAGF